MWKHSVRKDGTSNIKIYSYQEGKKKYVKTKFYALPKDWDERRGRLKPRAPFAAKINAILGRLEMEAKGEMMGVRSSLIRFVAEYVEDCRDGREGLRKGTWKKFISFRNKLQTYKDSRQLEDITFSQIDLAFYADFKNFLRDSGTGRSGVANHIKHLKKFMQLGLDRGLHNNVAFKAKSFKAERIRPNDKIYLTPEEISTMANLDLSGFPSLEKERDRFLVSYYLVMRFGDSLRINEGSISQHNGRYYYKNIAEKTETVSFVPIKPAALKLIRKHNYDFTGDTNQEANKKLKRIAAMAGFLTNMAEPGAPHQPKCSLVTTHTARRSAATNMHLAGMPLSEIMQLGGWRFEATLKQYLLAGGLDLAHISADREFFL